MGTAEPERQILAGRFVQSREASRPPPQPQSPSSKGYCGELQWRVIVCLHPAITKRVVVGLREGRAGGPQSRRWGPLGLRRCRPGGEPAGGAARAFPRGPLAGAQRLRRPGVASSSRPPRPSPLFPPSGCSLGQARALAGGKSQVLAGREAGAREEAARKVEAWNLFLRRRAKKKKASVPTGAAASRAGPGR